MPIVANGTAQAVILVPANASKSLRDCGVLLAKYVKASSGAEIPVRISDRARFDKGIKIHVGRTPYARRLMVPMDRVGQGDGFVITFPDEKNVVIAGYTDLGVEFGVYEFLERYVGVRWLLPGQAGEHVPMRESIEIPRKDVCEEPAFISRKLSGLKGQAQSAWARRNRMHGCIEFHHNLFELFPPHEYGKAHPEFFPTIGGTRCETPKDRKRGWQPCFTAPGIVEEAVSNICSHLSRYPEEKSYSLGVNDSGGHCECSRCLAKDSGQLNFLGYRDLSDRYFGWANAVVEGVLKEYPDKWFGCLAYSEVAAPPSGVSVNGRIIPYMTYDRMKWIDKDIERNSKKITERWAAKASQLGWYDYIYGTPYLLPRVYFHKMAEYYKYARAHGVRAVYAEAYPNWGEGPKLYVTLKLLWNPSRDVDTLLKEWYVCAVGEEGASDLAAYYDHWERFWTQRVLASDWFTREGQILGFNDPGYLEKVTFDDISKSRILLERVVAKTRTKKQRSRALLLLRAFEYYEASALSYLGLVEGRREPGKGEEYYENMNKKRYRLVDEFEKDSVLIHPLRFDKRCRKLNWGNEVPIGQSGGENRSQSNT
ncbi:MAG: DUF4838 domain-containing protein [Thermodesulfobacteriota bacterium]|nr:DUF4838 domain-containing protein [Thermodesulfobacteriota bacterium]